MNTLTISKRPIKAGMSQHTAEEQAQILNDITHPLATREDLSRLEAKMETFATKEDLLRLEAGIDKRFTSLQWMIGIMFVALGLIIAALKVL